MALRDILLYEEDELDVHVFGVRKQEDLMYLTHFEVSEASALSSSQTSRPNGEAILSTERFLDVVVGTPPYLRDRILDPFGGTGSFLAETSPVALISLRIAVYFSGGVVT